MTATNEAVLMTDPPPPSSRWGMPYLQQKKTDFTFTACTRSHTSTSVSSTEASSGGEMPALLNSTSMRSYAARTASYIERTASSSATSQANARSTPGESAARSTPTTIAPSSLKRRAVSAPMPLAAPVMTQTLPSSRPTRSAPRCVVDGLQLGVVLERVRAELAADARLLEPAERRGHAHGGVRVD